MTMLCWIMVFQIKWQGRNKRFIHITNILFTLIKGIFKVYKYKGPNNVNVITKVERKFERETSNI